MIERYFDIGGSVVRLTAKKDAVSIEMGILEPFVVEESPWDFWMDIDMVDELTEPEGELVYNSSERQVYQMKEAVVSYLGTTEKLWNHGFMRIFRQGNRSRIQAKRSAFLTPIHSKTILGAMEAEHLAVKNDGFLFHSSFICVDGEAILFTAASGVGKSTQAKLWETLRGAQILNGDRSVVRKTAQGFEAFGTPFAGSSGISSRARVPLKAIVVLAQAQKTSIAQLVGARAFRAIWEGCSLHTWNAEEVDHCSQLVTELITQVPIYLLACTPDETAVEVLEKELRK